MSDRKNRGRGRPRKAGRSVRITVRLREGEHDEILERLNRLPEGRRSSYVRRVLAGASVEALEEAYTQESAALAAALDAMWDEEWDED